MLPHLGALSHLYEDHDHKTCEKSQTHLHEIKLNCDILDYQFASSIQIPNQSNGNIISSFHQKKTFFFHLGYSFPIDLLDTVRGPPKA